MNLLALALGLFIERFLTEMFHLREARWLDSYFDRGLRLIGARRGLLAWIIAAAVVAVPVLPVLGFVYFFSHALYGVPYFIFAVVMLMFSLGPRDLEDEVDEYIEAVRENNTERAHHVAKELLETEPPGQSSNRTLAIEEAIFVQSNNRLFGVVFWFMVAGPVGAWAFRVSDMFRRRVHFEAGRAGGESRLSRAPARVHGLLAWMPARLLALAYALAGSFETAVSDWRAYYHNCSEHFFEVNDDIIACAGVGALGPPGEQSIGAEMQGARRAMRLVSRTLWVWLTAIAVLTIFGLAV